MAIDYQKTGRAISAYRQELKLSQQGLAELMNVTHQAVSKWENGAALPDTPTLLALSKLFGVSMEDLLMGEIREKKTPTLEQMNEQLKQMNAQINGDARATKQERKEMTMNTAQKEMEQAEKANREAMKQAQREIEEMAKSLESEIEADMREAFEAQEAAAEEVFADFVVMEEAEEGGETDSALAGELDEAAITRIAHMMPFVSTSMADELFRKLTAQGNVPVSKISQFAPFVSIGTLNEYVQHLIQRGLASEDVHKALMTLAPFLNQKTLERLVKGELGAIDSKLAATLMPFVNTKTADALVRRMLETQDEASGFAAPKPSREDVREKRTDVRFRIALKAMDSGNSDWLEDHAHELTEEQREQLAGKAIELGDTDMLEVLIVDLPSEALERLLEKAAESDNWELIELIEDQL